MATSSRPGSAEEAVRRLLEACGVPATDPLPLLVHRLDVGTSGVVLLARGDAAHRALSRALQQRTAEKTYRALVFGHPVPARGRIDLPLARDPKDGRKMRVEKDGKPSVTAYETLRRYASLADLRLSPETGRTHQIRVHLQALGHPVVGDTLYGAPHHITRQADPRAPRGKDTQAEALSLDRNFLHATRLAFRHPKTNKALTIESPLPPELNAFLSVIRSDGAQS
jgi:23S rRNA pseudouridine1911/1915/1917 synthase